MTAKRSTKKAATVSKAAGKSKGSASSTPGAKALKPVALGARAAHQPAKTSPSAAKDQDRLKTAATAAAAATLPAAAALAAVDLAATVANPTGSAKPASTAPTKKSLLLGLLQRPQGATIEQLAADLSWLPHTVRAALTGLRKTGHQIIRQTGSSKGTSVYLLSR